MRCLFHGLLLTSVLLSSASSYWLSVWLAVVSVADTQLYKRHCPSVGFSVRRLVGSSCWLRWKVVFAVYPALFLLSFLILSLSLSLSFSLSLSLFLFPSFSLSLFEICVPTRGRHGGPGGPLPYGAGRMSCYDWMGRKWVGQCSDLMKNHNKMYFEQGPAMWYD